MGFPAHTLSPAELALIVAAERAGDPFLAYRDEEGELRLLPLAGRESVVIGRAEESDVALAWDPQVSRTHAQLERLGGAWTLVDDGLSRNGSYVNSERVSGRRRLEDGDIVRVGHSNVVFRAPVRAAETTLTDAASPPALTQAERRVLVALCRPVASRTGAAVPAGNREIAAELHLSVPGVKTHIRALFAKFGVEDLPQYNKRTELARRALESGAVTRAQLLGDSEAPPTS
jgi:pSer/pThr/pTyr-binding forkhead associated (FHA) protein